MPTLGYTGSPPVRGRRPDPAALRVPVGGVPMLAIRELLSRVRHDPAFGAAEFALGCFDRVSGRVERIPLGRVRLTPGDRFAFEVLDGDGPPRRIPFHRVREVYRNGECIWSRPGAAGAGRSPEAG